MIQTSSAFAIAAPYSSTWSERQLYDEAPPLSEAGPESFSVLKRSGKERHQWEMDRQTQSHHALLNDTGRLSTPAPSRGRGRNPREVRRDSIILTKRHRNPNLKEWCVFWAQLAHVGINITGSISLAFAVELFGSFERRSSSSGGGTPTAHFTTLSTGWVMGVV